MYVQVWINVRRWLWNQLCETHLFLILTILIMSYADLAAPSLIKFGIESKHSSPLTSTDGFKKAIVQALRDMHDICEPREEEGIKDLDEQALDKEAVAREVSSRL